MLSVEENGFLTTLDEVEVETGFETFAQLLQANYLFRVQVWMLFGFLIGSGLRDDARQLPHKCGKKMITNNSYHEQ